MKTFKYLTAIALATSLSTAAIADAKQLHPQADSTTPTPITFKLGSAFAVVKHGRYGSYTFDHTQPMAGWYNPLMPIRNVKFQSDPVNWWPLNTASPADWQDHSIDTIADDQDNFTPDGYKADRRLTTLRLDAKFNKSKKLFTYPLTITSRYTLTPIQGNSLVETYNSKVIITKNNPCIGANGQLIGDLYLPLNKVDSPAIPSSVRQAICIKPNDPKNYDAEMKQACTNEKGKYEMNNCNYVVLSPDAFIEASKTRLKISKH